MLTSLVRAIKTKTYESEDANRRIAPRREVDQCIGMIEGKSYPVENWSDTGVLFAGNDKLFSIGEATSVDLKFKLSEKIITVSHRGKIVRKAKNKFAIQFEPLTRDIANKFQQIVDDFVTQEFADSQMA